MSPLFSFFFYNPGPGRNPRMAKFQFRPKKGHPGPGQKPNPGRLLIKAEFNGREYSISHIY